MTDKHAPATPLRRTNRSLPIALLRARETVMGPVREMLAGTPVNEQKWRVLRVLDESGYTGMWQADKNPDSPGRLENLKELVKALENFENLQGFLEHVSLVMDNDKQDSDQKVSIMTLHAAKGLEFPAVFLPGWEDGLFPSQRAMDEEGIKGLEEERRLAYVGITRAEELCTISFAGNRRVYGQWQSQMPSRFIDEDGQPLRIKQAGKLKQIAPADIFCRNPIGNGSAPVLRRSALDKIAFRHPADQHRLCFFDEQASCF